MFVRVIGAIFRNDEGKYLLLAHAKNKNKYTIPVGKVDGNENYFSALNREMREELGVEIKLATVVTEGDIVCNRTDGIKYYTQKTWFVDSYNGEPQNLEPHKHPDMGWFSVEEIEQLFLDGNILERTVTDIVKVDTMIRSWEDLHE